MFLVTVVVLATLGGARPLFASPNPSSQVAVSQAALDQALAEYDAAQKRFAATSASIAANSAKLDDLVARQAELESRLGTRASTMYRSGRLGFIEVLAGSATFEQFLTMWDALVRFNRQDAATIRELGKARAEIAENVKKMLARQAEASRQLRTLESAKAKAAKQLASDKAAYASYQREVAAKEAAATAAAQAAHARTTAPKAAPIPQVTGSGPWQTGVASHYGSGSYGIRLSTGDVIGPDSMVVAHKTLPFGTLVEFSYRGRTAVAKVADRGPFTAGRDWDLGPGVARVLGFRGVDKFDYRVIGR